MILELVALLVLSASVSSGDTLARPLSRSTPDYPAKCAPADKSLFPDQQATVVYDVSREGLPENVRIRESTDPCFEQSAVAAIRGSISSRAS